MSDVALANEPEARTATGEIKDQAPSPIPSATTETPTEAPKTTSPTASTAPSEAKPETKDGKSLLNKAEPAGAPEKYEAFKVPEGHEIPEDTNKEIGDMFKKLNLTQAQGQELVDYWARTSQESFDAPFKAWEALQEKWSSEVRADPEMGHRIPEIKTTVSKALDGLGDPKLATAFHEAMDLTGAGNHPAFVKAFWKLAQAVTEGGHVSGRGPSQFGQKAPDSGPRTAAQAIYPNLP